MTLVLVHGVPETASIWTELRGELPDLDIVTLSPPGFGAPVPDGFGATAGDYRSWLVAELEGFDAPVDLLGHDWGGAHVAGAAAARPDLVRSWITDIAGCHDRDYVWHDVAQIWQTPGDGEALVAAMADAPPEERVAQLTRSGMTDAGARRVIAQTRPEQGACILALYRSATQPGMADAGDALMAAPTPPCLVLVPTDDPYTGGEVLARRSAERLGAELAVLDGLGHWWMLHDPGTVAAVIRDFVARQG